MARHGLYWTQPLLAPGLPSQYLKMEARFPQRRVTAPVRFSHTLCPTINIIDPRCLPTPAPQQLHPCGPSPTEIAEQVQRRTDTGWPVPMPLPILSRILPTEWIGPPLSGPRQLSSTR